MQVLTREQFVASEAGTLAETLLGQLLASPLYHTITSYDIIVGRHMPFVERHLNYLASHPQIKPIAYITNLKVMIKVR